MKTARELANKFCIKMNLPGSKNYEQVLEFVEEIQKDATTDKFAWVWYLIASAFAVMFVASIIKAFNLAG